MWSFMAKCTTPLMFSAIGPSLVSSTPAQYALILIDLALEAGASRDELLAGTELAGGGSGGIGARIRDEDFHRLADHALRCSADPALGLRLGERLNLSAHAVLGQAFMTCRDLAGVLELFQRYYRVLAPDLELAFSFGSERVEITVRDSENWLPLSFGLECMTAAMFNTLKGLLGDRDLPLRFEFPYPQPAYREIYEQTLGTDLHFDRPEARWSFPATLLTARLPSSNPALRELYEAECARLLADLADSEDLCSQTRRLLRKFEGQYPKMQQLAAMLNLSPRTYRRRLAAEGMRFQQLLDGVRAEHADRYLRQGKLPLASIAYRLGFSDPSNFRRAYRRWTGRAPRRVQAGAAAAP